VLAYLSCPAAHRATLHSTSLLEHVNGEIKLSGNLQLIDPRS
jgi:hypothetical protein